MIAAYPLCNAFFKTSGKKLDPQQSQHKLKEDNNSGLDFDQAPLDAFGSPEGEEDNYHLGRTIYML